MKLQIPAEGGLRILAEEAHDWEVLRGLPRDATLPSRDLAERLGELLGPEAGGEDWQEYVVPDLHAHFSAEIETVSAAIHRAAALAGNGKGHLSIQPDKAATWYGVLNQARLALEETHRFGPEENLQPKMLTPAARSAYLRSRFYQSLQSVLLRHLWG
jgi:hypothetical protein